MKKFVLIENKVPVVHRLPQASYNLAEMDRIYSDLDILCRSWCISTLKATRTQKMNSDIVEMLKILNALLHVTKPYKFGGINYWTNKLKANSLICIDQIQFDFFHRVAELVGDEPIQQSHTVTRAKIGCDILKATSLFFLLRDLVKTLRPTYVHLN